MASLTRRFKRHMRSMNFQTGNIIKRPFGNSKALTNKRGKRSYIFQQNNMIVEVETENGPQQFIVPKTKTVTYKRRVFAYPDGTYPEGAVPAKMHVGGIPNSPAAKYKDIMVIEDTKTVPMNRLTRVKVN
jgi:hypothetical protein